MTLGKGIGEMSKLWGYRKGAAKEGVEGGESMQTHSDDVRMEVLNALYWDLAVPRDRLNVEVKTGWVTMSGLVDLPYQRECAEFDARNVPGVIGVINHICLAAKDPDATPAERH